VPRPTARPTTPALLLGALLAALAAPLPALATAAERVSVEALARASDAVVRGRVERRASRRVGPRIYTDVEVRAADVWRGGAPAVVKVVVPGGVVDGIGQRVDGAPSFTPGEEVVVFLSAGLRGEFRVNGLAQGKFRVEAGLVRPDLSGTVFLGGEAARGERIVEAMSVDELERRVREAR
jgi:hypothetical protein